LLALILIAACGPSQPASQKPASPSTVAHITISSPDLPGTVPAQFTCDGGGRVPRVQWTSYAAREWALEMLDPDAPSGTFVHWLVYSIPADATSVGPKLPTGALEGKNGSGRSGYTGPCPPPGPAHHYHFVVTALDSALGLSPGLSRSDLDGKIAGHAVATGELVVSYQRAA